MTTTIRCDIVSAEEEIFSGDVTMVVATGEMGELGIAPRHAPLITRLKPGKLVLTLANGEKLDIVVSGGISRCRPRSSRSCRHRDPRPPTSTRRPCSGQGRGRARAGQPGRAMDVAEAQQKLTEAMVQLQALERPAQEPQALMLERL